jgi:plasmid stability protein
MYGMIYGTWKWWTCMGMRKTTVYLDDRVKQRLARAAAEHGRSQAEIIRDGVNLALEQLEPPLPSFGIFDNGDPCISERVDELLEGFGEQ